VPNEIPLLAMVFCIQPWRLRAVGAYRGGRARTQFLRIATGIAIAALLGLGPGAALRLHPAPARTRLPTSTRPS
jgi:hypothetical protein